MTPPILFDLDGTLVDSHAVVERQWRIVCERLGLDFDELLAVLHGVRSVDTLRAFAPGADVEGEALALAAAEQADTVGLEPVAGAAGVLARLPPGGWGVVTSGHRALAQARLPAVGLPVPRVLVCADDVDRGKPDPEGYLRGASLLGVPAEACVVFEDAPAGVQAARAAGMRVIGITTTHAAADLAGAAVVIADLTEFGAALASLPPAPRR